MSSINQQVLRATAADKIIKVHTVQSLWSNYGAIKRFELLGGKYPSVIVKHIQLPSLIDHPKGWNTNTSHERKMRSYKIERKWYQTYAQQTTSDCRVPKSYYAMEKDDELLLIMEDLDASGFPLRYDQQRVNILQVKKCISWLAHFHAQYMEVEPEGLWPIGTYWHLATRPEELAQMENKGLKNAAKKIDQRLNTARFQTIVHGDAKLANFCFSKTDELAAVDFQYVGKGCGMKDVIYFMSSCFDEKECAKYQDELLSYYFHVLDISMDKERFDFPALKEEWLLLYPYAWADFYRFLDGWSPGHWKINSYSSALTQKVIDEINTSPC